MTNDFVPPGWDAPLSTVIEDFREAVLAARAIAEYERNPGLLYVLDRIAARGANLMDVARLAASARTALERIERGDVNVIMEWSRESEKREADALRAIARRELRPRHNFTDCIKAEGDKPCKDCAEYALDAVGVPKNSR